MQRQKSQNTHQIQLLIRVLRTLAVKCISVVAQTCDGEQDLEAVHPAVLGGLVGRR